MAYLIGASKLDQALAHPLAKILYERLENYASERTVFEPDWRLDYDAWRRVFSQAWKAAEGQDWRSRIFVGVTDLKVRIVAASIMNAIRDFPLTYQPTEDPETNPGVKLDPKVAELRARNMERKVKDLLTQMHAQRVIRDMVIELIVYGNVFSYCPVMVKYRRRRHFGELIPSYNGGGDQYAWRAYIDERSQLGFEHLNVWDVFKDPNAQTPQDGEGIGDRKMMTGGEFLGFCQSSYGFIMSYVKDIIKKSRDTEDSTGRDHTPTHGDEGPERDAIAYRKGPIEVFRYAGRISKAEMENNGVTNDWKLLRDQYSDEEWKENEDFEILAVVASSGDRFGIVKCVRNPNFGYRPYQQSVFRKIPHRAYGDSLPRGMRDSQMMINGTTRGLLDNLNISATATGAINPRHFEPWESNEFTPGKFLQLSQSFMGDIKTVLYPFEFPNYTQAIMPVIEKFQQWASEESVPNLLGGQTEQHQPRTAFQTSKLWEGAHLLLSEPLKNLDDGTFVPIGEEFYHYLMSDRTVPQDCKGDFTCKAMGYQGFEEKHLKSQKVLQLMQMAVGSDILVQLTHFRELWERLIVSMDEDPAKIIPSETEMAQKLLQAQQALAQQAQVIEGFQKMFTGGVSGNIMMGGVQ